MAEKTVTGMTRQMDVEEKYDLGLKLKERTKGEKYKPSKENSKQSILLSNQCVFSQKSNRA